MRKVSPQNRKIGRALAAALRFKGLATEDQTIKAALPTYQARMQRVLDHIDDHLDGDLELDALSGVAAFSKFHFHRQFSATFGITLARYVQLTRMKQASHRLAQGAGESVTEAALDAGYEAPDAFARAFRRQVGQSPSAFRTAPDWDLWLTAFGPLEKARSQIMQIIFEAGDVAVREEPDAPVAILEHRGDRAGLPATFAAYRDWRRDAGLSPETCPTYTVFRSERQPANPADYSMDICCGTDLPAAAIGDPMKAGVIPGGRCAVLRYPGNTDNLEPAALYLYREWLPASGEEARDFPVYVRRRLAAIPGVGAQEVVTEVFLPLR